MSGGLFYPVLSQVTLVGTKSGTTCTPVALTANYNSTVSKTFPVGGNSELVLYIAYTTGSGETSNSIETKIEAGNDSTNLYQLTNEHALAGVSTITQREFTFVGASAGTAYKITYRLDVTYPIMKVSFKESGVVTNAGTVFCEATLGGY